MIPLLWRYLLSLYLKVFLLCLTSFTFLLLITRLESVAHFSTLGPETKYIFWFFLYQAAYILPIAIPLSCLISSVVLAQKLSHTHELTAMRSCQISLRGFLTPILLTSGILSLLNFYIVSELATESHLKTRLLEEEFKAMNPLILLQNPLALKRKGVYINTLGRSKPGESITDVVFVVPNKNHRLDLVLAKNLSLSSTSLEAQDLSFLSNTHSNSRDFYDHLLIENIESAKTPIKSFLQMLTKNSWRLNNDHLKLSLLLVRLSERKKALSEAKRNFYLQQEVQSIQREVNRCYSELARRFSLGIAAFPFTLMGAAFGINFSRYRSSTKLFAIISLTSAYLICFFLAKGFDHSLLLSLPLYLVPPAFIIAKSYWTLSQVNRGILI